MTIDNIDSTLLEQIKKLAIQAGASFRILPTETPKPKALSTLPPFNQAIVDMPRGNDNEDIFVREYPQDYHSRELDWTD